jgi:hypothetical protein
VTNDREAGRKLHPVVTKDGMLSGALIALHVAPPGFQPISALPAGAQHTAVESHFIGPWRLVSAEVNANHGTKAPDSGVWTVGEAYLIYMVDRENRILKSN